MISIYIYETDDLLKGKMIQEINNYISERRLPMKIVFGGSDIRGILKRLVKDKRRGLYFIDACEGAADSIKLGELIREEDPRGYIVYITSYKNLEIYGFEHHIEVMDYIFKSDGVKQELFQAVRRCLDTAAKRTEDEYRSKLLIICRSGSE